jgi:hypothetical protein
MNQILAGSMSGPVFKTLVEITEREPLSFTITIIPATKEPCPEQFQSISFFIIVFGKIYILL